MNLERFHFTESDIDVLSDEECEEKFNKCYHTLFYALDFKSIMKKFYNKYPQIFTHEKVENLFYNIWVSRCPLKAKDIHFLMRKLKLTYSNFPYFLDYLLIFRESTGANEIIEYANSELTDLHIKYLKLSSIFNPEIYMFIVEKYSFKLFEIEELSPDKKKRGIKYGFDVCFYYFKGKYCREILKYFSDEEYLIKALIKPLAPIESKNKVKMIIDLHPELISHSYEDGNGILHQCVIYDNLIGVNFFSTYPELNFKNENSQLPAVIKSAKTQKKIISTMTKRR